MSQDKAKAEISRYRRMKSDRAVWEGHWQEIVDYVLPNRAGFTNSTAPGSKRMQKVYDATAPWANEQLAAALHGMLTNPAVKWFQLRTKKRDLMEDPEVALWLEQVQDVIYDVFNSPEANFNSQAHELYLDLGGFGTAVMLIEEAPGTAAGVRYRTWFLGECLISENKNGLVDTMYRKFKLTARVAIQTWGLDAVGKKITDIYAKNPDQLVDILHVVKPRTERNPDRLDPVNKAFSSCYYGVEEEILIDEGGFDRFPFLVPRWSKMAGETYGRSPAMTALPDIKMLNEMCKTTIRAAQKIVDPPLMVPDDGFFLPIRTTPAGLNFFRTGIGDNSMIRPLETKGNVPLGLEMEDQRRQAILRAFYQDRLKLQKEKIEMTKTEAIIRDQENLRMMSPTVGRIEIEFLNECIGTTFAYKLKQGAFPEPPQILENEELAVEYISPIARAQKSGESEAINRAMAMLAPIGQFDPQIFDNFDGDEVARSSREWFGIPARIMKPRSVVEQIRRTRAERAQAEQEKIDAERTAKASADAAKASAAA